MSPLYSQCQYAASPGPAVSASTVVPPSSLRSPNRLPAYMVRQLPAPRSSVWREEELQTRTRSLETTQLGAWPGVVAVNWVVTTWLSYWGWTAVRQASQAWVSLREVISSVSSLVKSVPGGEPLAWPGEPCTWP